MSKILFNNHKFEGGSPKSMLEYARIANQEFEVVTIGEPIKDDKIIDLYIQNKLKTIASPSFHLMQPIKNWKLILNYLKIIKSEKPDLIQTTTAENMFFDYILSKITNIPVIYLIAGGRFPATIRIAIGNIIHHETMIVISEESKRELEHINHKNNNEVYVIPNRITVDHFTEGQDNYNQSPIKALLITRFANSKMKSVEYTIDLVKALQEKGIPIELTILGDGEHFETTKQKVDKINSVHNHPIINLEGHTNNVEPYVLNSHMVFGKGRSTLDGVFSNRISFVVNENNQSFIVNEDTFSDLLDSNFTGRNFKDLIQMKFEDYIKITQLIVESKVDFSKLEAINNIAKESYDINRVANKIVKIYNKKIKSNTKKINYEPNKIHVFYQFVKVYLIFIKSKISNLI